MAGGVINFSGAHNEPSSPSCSFCFTRSLPPTIPIFVWVRRVFRNAMISGVAFFLDGVRVPSTSKSTMRDPAGADAIARRGAWEAASRPNDANELRARILKRRRSFYTWAQIPSPALEAGAGAVGRCDAKATIYKSARAV